MAKVRYGESFGEWVIFPDRNHPPCSAEGNAEAPAQHRAPMSTTTESQSQLTVQLHQGASIEQHYDRWALYLRSQGIHALSRHPGWLTILKNSMGHEPYCLEAVGSHGICGLLPLASVQSWLFGRFLVSMPYLNSGGAVADNPEVSGRLVEEAIALADSLDVKYLELRHEAGLEHSGFTDQVENKVHMRLSLPETPGTLWDGFSPKVRNQVRKAQKNHLVAKWGQTELLSDFYSVFSQNMRDLGTPVYSRKLFEQILRTFPQQTEIGIVYNGKEPWAVGLLLHGNGITEIPSASSLREHNKLCPNMLLYWTALERAIERGQQTFDFGRSTPGSPTYRFKKQWGALPEDAIWQYYRRHGGVKDARPDNPRYQRLIKLWQKLPVSVANVLGPFVVRGIP